MAAKAGGVRLGNPQNCFAVLRRAGEGGALLREAIARNADRHARDLRRVVEDIRTTGLTSLGASADAERHLRGFNGRMRAQLLNETLFFDLEQVRRKSLLG